MVNQVKTVKKLRFESSARAGRPRTAVRTDRVTITVDRGRIPTATGIAYQLGWFEREAALDRTSLFVGGRGRHLWEGDSTRALWERSEVTHVDVDASASLGEPYAAEVGALTSGDVDAIFVAGAAGAAAAARIGATPVVDVGRHLDPAVRASATTPAAIVVDAELLEREPNLVVRLLAVLLAAERVACA